MYFTYRNLFIDGKSISIQEGTKHTFNGLGCSITTLLGDNSRDSRYLACYEYNGSLSDSEIEGVISEALAIFSYHKKTELKALEFAKYITGDDNLTLISLSSSMTNGL